MHGQYKGTLLSFSYFLFWSIERTKKYFMYRKISY